MKKNVYFVSGIDTNIGKSYATAYLARVWREKGINVITQKFIQTGNPAGYSEDIELHRRLMGLEYLPEDIQHSGYPLVFVTSGRLGSVNHTLLSFEAIERRGISLHTVMYNLYPEGEDKIIQEDTENYIRHYMEKHFPEAEFVKVPCL